MSSAPPEAHSVEPIDQQLEDEQVSDSDSIDTEVLDSAVDADALPFPPPQQSKLKPKSKLSRQLDTGANLNKVNIDQSNKQSNKLNQANSQANNQSSNQSLNRPNNQPADPSAGSVMSPEDQFMEAHRQLIEREKAKANEADELFRPSNARDDIMDIDLENENIIPESPTFNQSSQPVQHSQQSHLPSDQLNGGDSNNQSINQTNEVRAAAISTSVKSIHATKLKPRTRTIPMEWAVERGCDPETSNKSLILSVSAMSLEGQRFVDCSAIFSSRDQTTRLVNLSNYLSSIMLPPWVPLVIAQAADQMSALDTLSATYAEDPINQSINQWVQTAKEKFIQPLSLERNGLCPAPIQEPVNAADNSQPVTIAKAISWANILTDDSSALINRSRNENQNPVKQLKLKLCFNNALVCNLAIAQLNAWHSLKSNISMSNQYQSISAQQLSAPKDDGFKVVVPAYLKNRHTNSRSALQHLNQPILSAFDKLDHGVGQLTLRPSLVFNLDLKLSVFETRYAVCRIEGLAVNSTNHPYAATKSSINQPASISDTDAMESLRRFICYHPALQTGATCITVPKMSKGRKKGMCFVTTPRQNIIVLSRLVSHWRANPSAVESEAWVCPVSVDVSKEALSFCEYCQLPGHHQSTCPTLALGSPALVDSSNIPIPLCKRCHTPNIPDHACVMLSDVKCLLCNELGHSSRDCHIGQRSWSHVAGAKRNQPAKTSKNVSHSSPQHQTTPISAPRQVSQPDQASATVIVQPDAVTSSLAAMRHELVEMQKKLMDQMYEQMIKTMLLMQSSMQTSVLESVQFIVAAMNPSSSTSSQTNQSSLVSQPQHSLASISTSPQHKTTKLVDQSINQNHTAAASASITIPPKAVENSLLAQALTSCSMDEVVLHLSRSHNIDNIITQLQRIQSDIHV